MVASPPTTHLWVPGAVKVYPTPSLYHYKDYQAFYRSSPPQVQNLISAMHCFKSAFACQPVILVLTCGLVLLLLRQICMALYRLFFHPLSGFPGPWFAAITPMYKTYYEVFKGGELLQKIHKLHSVYGGYIRLYAASAMLTISS